MLISLNNLTFGYDDVTVLEDVDVTVNENDRIGLVGVNGSGKSTLIKLMLGFLHADWGEVLKKANCRSGICRKTPFWTASLPSKAKPIPFFRGACCGR